MTQLDREGERYLDQVTRRLLCALGEDLVAVYLVGSGALGEWDRARSDIDVMAICALPLSAAARPRLVEPLRHRALPCPARGLELVLYRRDAVKAPGRRVDFELNLNTGPRMDEHVSFDPPGEPGHWFVIDLAIARLHGRPLVGPAPQELIGPLARADVLAALAESLRWHDEHESASANAVLNACRAWRYAAEGTWSPKGAAGRWALEQGAERTPVCQALRLHAGERGAIDGAAVRQLLTRVSSALAGAHW